MDARATGDKEKVQAYYYQQNDASMLRLFEAFLESAPQLTLQLYIMVATKDANWLTGLSLEQFQSESRFLYFSSNSKSFYIVLI